MNKKISLCGGGIVFKRRKGVIYFLLIEHKELGWVLPKGHCEQEETPEQTAVREVFEETGFDFSNSKEKRKIGQISYEVENKEKKETEIKTIYYYLSEMTPEIKVSDNNRTQGERARLGKVEWFPAEEAIKKVSFSDTKDILRKALKKLKGK